MESESTSESVDETNKLKRFKSLNDSVVINANCRRLLDLSDDVLLIIFAYLAPCDLISLSRTCSRLWSLTRDRTLWTRVECRADGCHLTSDATFNAVVRRLLPTTTLLAVKLHADSDAKFQPSPDNMRAIVCQSPRLHTLVLEGARIDAKLLTIQHFPATLQHLSLKGSSVVNLPDTASYFLQIHKHLPQLQVLNLSECLWFQSHSIMAVAKCEQLRELRLAGCHQLGNCMAYCSMSARFAFKSLELLDLRGTRMGDSEVACLNRVSTLRHLYLSCATAATPAPPSDARTGANIRLMMPRTHQEVPYYPDNGPRCLIILQRVNNQFVVNRHVNLRPDIHEDEVRHLVRGAGDVPEAPPDEVPPLAQPPREEEPQAGQQLVVTVNGNPHEVGSDLSLGGGVDVRNENQVPVPAVVIFENGAASRDEKRGRDGEDDGDERGRAKRKPSAGSVNCDNGNSSKAKDDAARVENDSGKGEHETGFSRPKQYVTVRINRRSDNVGEGCSKDEVNVGAGCSREGLKDDIAKEGELGRSKEDGGEGLEDSDDDIEYDHYSYSRNSDGLSIHFRSGRPKRDWENVSPEDRVREAEAMNRNAIAYIHNPEPIPASRLVTDSSVYDLFGNHEHSRVVVLRMPCDQPSVSRLETLVLRNFPGVTDSSLLVLAEVPTLRYLDVTGTGVTLEAVGTFKTLRPDVVVVTSFGPDEVRDDLT